MNCNHVDCCNRNSGGAFMINAITTGKNACCGAGVGLRQKILPLTVAIVMFGAACVAVTPAKSGAATVATGLVPLGGGQRTISFLNNEPNGGTPWIARSCASA